MDDNEDRTQVVGAGDARRLAAGGAMPPGRLICSDPSSLEDGVGAEILLSGEKVTVGRSSEAKIRIKSSSISRVHAEIYPGAGFWGIKDLGSTNGVKINGEAVEQGWMRNGDRVTIGKVDYAFTQEKPKPKETEASFPGATDTIVSDRTMFVGQDTSAASALLKATAAASKPEPETSSATEPNVTDRSKTKGGQSPAASHAGADSSAKKAFPTVKVGAGVGALVVVLVGYFALFGGNAEVRDAIEQNEQSIKRFIARDERGGIVSGDTLVQQINELKTMREVLAPLVAANSETPELRELQVSIAFLEFSRQFASAMKAKDLDQARRQAAGVSAMLEFGESTKVSEGEIGKRYTEIVSLLQLAETGVRLKAFVTKYSEPESETSEKPTKEMLDKIQETRQQFASLKKQHNLAVTVTYPYFGVGIGEIGDNDLSLIDRWQRTMQ